ncbi:MAG: DUF6427 family protein [Mangrovibacterium sp.]
MIYRLIHNNKSHHFIALPLLALVLWIGALINPVEHHFAIDLTHQIPLAQPLFLINQWSPLASSIVALVLTILTALLLVQTNHRYLFLEQKTFLPGYLFVIIIGGLVSLKYLNPLYVTNVLGSIALIHIFDSPRENTSLSTLFNTGFIFGICSLFYLSFVFLLPLVWIAFQLITKNINWRHFALPLMGLILPWIHVASYYYFIDQIPLLIEIIQNNFSIPEHLIFGDMTMLYYIAFIILLAAMSSIGIFFTFEKRGSTHRYFFQTYLAIGVASPLLVIFIPSVSKEMLLTVIAPIACILANYLIVIPSKFWANIILFVLLLIVIYIQFA